MSQMPISSSPFDKVIKAVAAVRTKGAFASVNILLLSIVFAILMVFGASVTANQMWLIIVFLIVWQAFAVFSMVSLPAQEGNKPSSVAKEREEDTRVSESLIDTKEAKNKTVRKKSKANRD